MNRAPRDRGSASARQVAASVPRRRLLQRRSWRFWAAAVAAATLTVLGLSLARRTVYSASLPALPDLSRQPAAVRAHLMEADRVARAHPTSVEAVGAAGLAYHADMFYEQAQRCYAIAEELSGSAWRWTYYRALAQGARGDADGLAVGLRRVVAAAPEFSPAWWQLGEVEFKAGRYERAEEAWRRVLTLQEPSRPAPRAGSPARVASAPISAYAALGLARVAMLHGGAERARETLESVTEKSPGFGSAFRLLGSAYAALNRSEDAKRAVRIADRLPAYDPYIDPMIDALARESRSSTFLLQQASTADLDTNAAWREYLVRRAMEFDPANTGALYDLASMFLVLRRYDEALDLLERYGHLVPGDFQALADIGRCLSGLQRYAEAEPVLRRAAEGVDDANAHYSLGFALDHLGRLPEAVAEYQRALERNPNHKDALNNLGVSFVRQGKLDQATRLFERLLATDPDNADAHTNLGAVFLTQGAHDLADREFKAALQLNPDHALAREGLRKIKR
jgi:tetratricopeptide (TPR) repeat protein